MSTASGPSLLSSRFCGLMSRWTRLRSQRQRRPAAAPAPQRRRRALSVCARARRPGLPARAIVVAARTQLREEHLRRGLREGAARPDKLREVAACAPAHRQRAVHAQISFAAVCNILSAPCAQARTAAVLKYEVNVFLRFLRATQVQRDTQAQSD